MASPLSGQDARQWGKNVPVFVGTHINRIDRKGRVSVPAAFRNTLGDPLPQGIYAMRSIRGIAALDAFGPADFAELAQSITNPFASDDEDATSAIFGSAQLLTFDAEGRIILPDGLRGHAGIDGEVCFIGRGPSFQMWEPGAGQAHQEEAFRRATENRANLNLKFARRGDGGAS